MKTKKFAALLLAVVMILTLTACGGNEGGSSKAEDKTITFWSVFTGGDGTAMQKIIDAYNATNPEYKVEHIMVEQNDLYTKLPLVINSQEGVPDLVIQHVDRLASNARSNMYLSMNDYIAASGKIKAENYIDSAWTIIPTRLCKVRYQKIAVFAELCSSFCQKAARFFQREEKLKNRTAVNKEKTVFFLPLRGSPF